jgi:hypothetical protein
MQHKLLKTTQIYSEFKIAKDQYQNSGHKMQNSTQSTCDSDVAEHEAPSSANAHFFKVPSRLPVKR